MTTPTLELVGSIDQVNANEWNLLNRNQCPFLSHEFLYALEASESVCSDTGWQPCHVIALDEHNTLIAAMPAYVKNHSYGEYVFDWSWANAYQRSGRDYYPKIISAVPFSPVTSDRLLVGANTQEYASQFARDAHKKLGQLSLEIGASSTHILFPTATQKEFFSDLGMLSRIDCQYHWFNEEFDSFNEFLTTFSSRKRKNIRKERARVEQQGIELVQLSGAEITENDWSDFYRFYHMTYYKRGGSGYLNQSFFEHIAHNMGEQLVMVVARRDQQAVGAALCFRDNNTLYGRYWGCLEEYEFLHFEACYYQGIDYCIRHGLTRFDPGAQGQHKISRGFIPVFTHSCHSIIEPEFSEAVANFLQRETQHIEEYRLEACGLLPFNQQYLDSTKHQAQLKEGKIQ